MAAGYIGKISAVVTANTSDLTKKLNDAGQNTKRFSEDLNRSISSAANSAQNSLQKIFTPLQNIERRLQTSLKVPGLALPLDEIRQAVSITEQLNKPLASVREGFSRLSLDVQAAFLPALQGAQDEVVKLNLLLQNTGSVSEQSLERARLAVEKLAAAQARLQQAQQIAARGNTGRELQFTDPRAYESLNRTAQLTQRAGSLPAAQLADGSVAKLVRELDRLQQVTQRSQAQLESLRLSPNVDTSALADAERRLERVIALARITQDQLETALTPPPSDATVTDEEIKALIEKERRSKETEERIYAAKKQIIDRETQDLIDKERRAQQTEENIYRTKKEITDKEIADLIAKQQRAKQVESLTNNNRSAQFLTSFGGGTGGLSAAFDERAIRSYSAQLQVLQAAIGKVSSEARGPAYTAFQKLRDAIADAMDRGELETEQTRQKLKALTAEAVNATASITGIGAKGLGRSVERAGDIGRAGFDKFSLAANQAAFAIDDFLSATGGIEFRIRAVQNNLTQLAFILGDTKGLFVGLGVAIAAQAAVALSQFLLEGRKTEDVVKSLNDSLRRQQELADGIASSIADIADSFAGDVFSDATKSADAFSEKLKKLITDLADLREARIGAADASFQQNQADVNSLERRLSNESDGGVRIAIQRQLVSAREQSDRLIAAAAARGGSRTLEQNIARFREAAIAFEQTKIDAELSKNTDAFVTITPRRAAENIDSLLSGITTQDQLRSLIESRSLETSRSISTGDGIARALTSQQAATSEIQALESIAISMDGYDAAAESLARFAEESDSIRQSLSDARNRLEDFGDGVDSASGFSDMLDQAGRVVEEAFKNVSDAFEQAAAETTSFDDFNTAVREAIASVNTESDRRKKLVADIASVFNEEEAARRDELKKAEDAAARKAEQDRNRAEEELRSSAERGRRLLLGEQGRAAEELRKNLNDVQAAGGTQQQVQAYARDVAQQSAPAIFALQEAVANAVASGPSREKLSASDISTQQGNSELMRLIRGDDAARAQNLQELRTQSSLLRRLVSVTQNNQAGVAD